MSREFRLLQGANGRYDIGPGDLRWLPDDAPIVQFTEALTEGDHRWLGAWFGQHTGAHLRVYGSYGDQIHDLEFLRHYPTLRGFSIDGVGPSLDLAGLRHLPDSIENLDLGVDAGEHGHALLARCRAIRNLSLGGHKRLPPTLFGLTSLRMIAVAGPVRDLDVVSSLTEVEHVVLLSMTLPDLSPLLPLRRLTSLDLKLGGTRDLTLLPELGPLTYLEIWQVRGLDDLSALGGVTTLESLKLESLARVSALPDLSRLTALKKVELQNMKGLTDLSPLATAPALETLWLIASAHLTPDAVLPLRGHPTLREARLGLGSIRKNAKATALLGLPEG